MSPLAVSNQVTRFKRERDTFRHMLDGAQKTISELRSNPGANKRLSTISSAEEVSLKMLKFILFQVIV